MSTDLAQGIGDQDTQAAESGATSATGGGQSGSINETEGVQSQTGDNAQAEGEGQLPPELQEARKKLFQDYHRKTQELAAKERALDGRVKDLQYSHDILTGLMDQEWFKQAYADHKANRTGRPAELSDEEFQRLRDDKAAFRDYVRKEAESLLESKYGNEFSSQKAELQSLRRNAQVAALAEKYPDFKGIHAAGQLDEFTKNGESLESAYALFKLRNGPKKLEVEEEAKRLLETRRMAAVDKPGVPLMRGQRVIKANNFTEAFDRLWEAHEKGENNLRVERS